MKDASKQNAESDAGSQADKNSGASGNGSPGIGSGSTEGGESSVQQCGSRFVFGADSNIGSNASYQAGAETSAGRR